MQLNVSALDYVHLVSAFPVYLINAEALIDGRECCNMERSIRKWVLWIYNIKFKFRNINAIRFLFLTQHTTPLLYVKINFGVLHMRGTDVTRSDTP